jgi:TonB family protein
VGRWRPRSRRAPTSRLEPAIWSNGTKTRDPRQIACVIDKHKGKIYAAYRQALLKEPNLAGKIEFSFQIDARGRVQNAKIARSNFNNPDFENKLLKQLATFQWPAIAGASWSGSHPFTFVSL